jgi:PAS domain S-box-containing protein
MDFQAYINDSEDAYRTLVDTASDSGLGIFILQDREDKEGAYQFVNEEYCRISGYREEELLKMTFYETTHPDFRAKAIERYRERKRGMPHARLYEIDMLTKDGKRVPIQYSSGLTNYRGRLAFIGYLRDVSEQKKLEGHLFMSEKMVSIGRLVAGIAHEINNPLTAVSSFIQILNERNLEGEVKGYIQTMGELVKRIQGIVSQLSMISRPQIEILSEVDLGRLLNLAVETVKLDPRSTAVRIHLRTDETCPRVVGDENQLLQVLLNIMFNALDAMPKGGDLDLESAPHRHSGHVQPHALLTIRDTGIGIRAADRLKIFDPFFTTKEVGKGTGMGLFVSYEIIKKIKGRIEFESEEGSGTTFRIFLPGAAGLD